MKYSARSLGQMIGETAREVNQRLFEHGLLSGQPGNWKLTELGKMFGEQRYWSNGYGGRAARDFIYIVWDKAVLEKLGRKEVI